MSSFPTSFSRAPTLQQSMLYLSRINASNNQLGRINTQLSSGLDLLRPSDDPVRFAVISTLDERIEDADQVLKNIDFANSSSGTLDNALAEAKGLVDEALSLASSQINSDPETRASQAVIVDSLIESVFSIANEKSLVGFTFGGTAPGRQPIVFDRGAYRFVGETGELTAALGAASDVPITLGVGAAIGELSSRIEGVGDLDPDLTDNTLLTDLNGATGTGIDTGRFEFSHNGGPTTAIDIDGAKTVGDVLDAITSAIRLYESENAVTVLGPGGVSTSGGAISIDVASGNLTFTDVQGAGVAESLGLAPPTPAPFSATNPQGVDLDPRLTWTTPVSALSGAGGPLGSIVVTNNGTRRTLDLSGAETLADIRSAIESDNSGVRLTIGENGRTLDLFTESAGVADLAMSVSQVAGDDTAERLGIRSYADFTRLRDFNDGDGVDVVSGVTNPVTGLVDPTLNVDFTIALGDGFEIDIDLSPGDLVNVGVLVTTLNAQADAALAAAGRPATDFNAIVGETENGIEFYQDPSIAPSGIISVTPKNNSTAAEQLGLMDARPISAGEGIRAEDRARVRVDNIFTHLLDLAESLRQNDTFGIENAASDLQASQDRLIQARSRVGGHARRLEDEQRRQEDRLVFDQSVRSNIRDLDYASAASEFAQIQLQLQAGLSVAAQSQQLSLLNFLG